MSETFFWLTQASRLGGAYQGSRAIAESARVEGRAYDVNAKIADMQARSAIVRGREAAERHLEQVRGAIGSQRALAAARGVVVGEGSAAQIEKQTAKLGAVDAMTIENNAWREAWGYRFQGSEQRFRATLARLTGRARAQATLLGGVLGVQGAIGQRYYGVRDTSGLTSGSLEDLRAMEMSLRGGG